MTSVSINDSNKRRKLPSQPPSPPKLSLASLESLKCSSANANARISKEQKIELGPPWNFKALISNGTILHVQRADKEHEPVKLRNLQGKRGNSVCLVDGNVVLKCVDPESKCEMMIEVATLVHLLESDDKSPSYIPSLVHADPQRLILATSFEGQDLMDLCIDIQSQQQSKGLTDSDAWMVEGTRRELITKLARAVEWIHQQGVVHGDIKPENVAVHIPDTDRVLRERNNYQLCATGGGLRVKLIDFGAATMRSESAKKVPYSESIDMLSTMVVGGGTAAALPPEAWGGKVLRHEERKLVDAFGVGVVLHLVGARRLFALRKAHKQPWCKVLKQHGIRCPPDKRVKKLMTENLPHTIEELKGDTVPWEWEALSHLLEADADKRWGMTKMVTYMAEIQ